MAQRRFDLNMLLIGHHCVLRGFAAGAGRGGNGDQRQGHRLHWRITDFLQIARGIQRVLHHRAKGFSRIQHAAATNRHHAINMAAPASHPAINLIWRGFMADNLVTDDVIVERGT